MMGLDADALFVNLTIGLGASSNVAPRPQISVGARYARRGRRFQPFATH